VNIVAYTSSLNDKSALKRCIHALLNQTYSVSEIIVVDNGSSDGTTLETFPDKVTLICNAKNLGVGGAVATAIQYALTKNYDWIWVLDQDSVPRKDALFKLVELYNSFPPALQKQTGVLSSLCVYPGIKKEVHGTLLTPMGKRSVRVAPKELYYECDATIWSGSMYSLHSVRKVGLPRYGMQGYWDDFGMDWGGSRVWVSDQAGRVQGLCSPGKHSGTYCR